MRENLRLTKTVVLVTGAMGLLASCTTDKVYSVVPPPKPSAQEIAMLTSIQTTDTTSTAMVENPPVPMQPVDLATDKSVAMAYAIPEPKPDPQQAEAMNAMQVASADPTVLNDGMEQPQLSVSAAMVEEQPKTRSLEPFVTSTKNTNLDELINKYATLYDVPESLVHHVVRRESNYNPGALHHGNWGLMQIRYNTARGLGYNGTANGLLDAETNLKYAVKYLKGAWLVAGKDAVKADWLYRTGYYYEAKKKRLLAAIGVD
jgi:soluble lytic murein transglycosylase-like protein